jgi:chromate transporter
MIREQNRRGSPWEVLAVFLRLGLTCFGGPAAHLGYFRAEFVQRRQWLDEAGYAALVGLCQVLPGPASSQTGFAIGLKRAGLAGGIAAWAGFTLPSALVMLVFAFGGSWLKATGILHGLKLVAVAIVAQAVLGMAKTLCPDRPRGGIATLALVLAVMVPGGPDRSARSWWARWPGWCCAVAETGAVPGWARHRCRIDWALPRLRVSACCWCCR